MTPTVGVNVRKSTATKLKGMAMTGMLSGALLVGGLSGGAEAYAEEVKVISKETVNVTTDGTYKDKLSDGTVSYNPTEPEIQLGDVSLVDIVESGAVTLDKNAAQGQLDDTDSVAIDGVKGKGVLYYILEKDGDIVSVHVKENKITGTDGSSVKIKDVDAIHGNNGTADKDGFKSNLVPDDVLPKTGDSPVSAETYGYLAAFLGLMGIGIGVHQRRKNQLG